MNHLPHLKNGVTMLNCNPDKYRHAIASLNMSTTQEDELIYCIWDIMNMFAELGHGVHSINTISSIFVEKARQESGEIATKTIR
jgi:Zn-dependent oligopeptidase